MLWTRKAKTILPENRTWNDCAPPSDDWLSFPASLANRKLFPCLRLPLMAQRQPSHRGSEWPFCFAPRCILPSRVGRGRVKEGVKGRCSWPRANIRFNSEFSADSQIVFCGESLRRTPPAEQGSHTAADCICARFIGYSLPAADLPAQATCGRGRRWRGNSLSIPRTRPCSPAWSESPSGR